MKICLSKRWPLERVCVQGTFGEDSRPNLDAPQRISLKSYGLMKRVGGFAVATTVLSTLGCHLASKAQMLSDALLSAAYKSIQGIIDSVLARLHERRQFHVVRT